MFSFFKRSNPALSTELAGIVFNNPLGLYFPEGGRKSYLGTNAGFVTLTPPKQQVIEWVTSLNTKPLNSVIAVNVNADIPRTFSLVYDFADLIIIDPDNDNGIGAADISDTHNLLDELMSLRLCYERYTPVFLRLSHGLTDEEMQYLLSSSQMSGLDGAVVTGLRALKKAREITLGRFPLIGVSDNPEDAQMQLAAGASLVECHMHLTSFLLLMKTIEKQASTKK